jgi:hypothetical protein
LSTNTLKMVAVIAAAVIVLAAAPAAFDAYGKYRLISAVDAVGVQVKHLALINRLESPQRSMFRITLTLTNDGPLLVDYTAGGILATLGQNAIAISGSDQGSLAPGESVDLTRDFMLAEALLAGLRGQGQLRMTGNLELTASASWLSWEVERDLPGKFEHTVLFD